MRVAIAALACFLLLAGSAQAYIGPGLGAGTLAVVLGVLGSILLAVFAVVWYPLKRMMKRRRKAAASDTETKPDTDSRT